MFVARRADGAFDREVLITFLRPDAANPFARQDFEREVELQATLEHPGIAKLYGADTTEGGIPYMVTEYLPGQDIEVYLDAKRAGLQERIELFLELCQAVQHAHEQGIVGLHLQTNNVHLLPDGTIRTVVYGLAHSNPSAARVLEPIWPQYAIEYASPEEWAGAPITGVADVYSLGVVLHVLLTGELAHDLQGLTPAEAAAQVHQDWLEPASARVRQRGDATRARARGLNVKQWAHALDGDLDRILAKALAQDSSRRYQTPLALAEDLERHLQGKPIRARGPAPFYALRRGFARHRSAVLASVAVLGTLGWALSASYRSSVRAQIALEDARRAELEADHQSTRLRELCIRFLTELGPTMQGRSGLEDARRYLLNVGTPLLDHLQETGYEDPHLRAQIAQSYSQLAEADWIAQDVGSFARTPDSVRRARTLTRSVLLSTQGPATDRGIMSWVRSVRCAIWFAGLMLDEPAGMQALAESQQELEEAGLRESDLPPLAMVHWLEARRSLFASRMHYDEAIDLWDLRRIRSLAGSDPAMEPFFRGDYPRFEAYRANLLLQSGREREALFELPTLVYQLREEARSHDPPVADLVQLEASTWLMLALARTRVGLPPGDALLEARSSLELIQNSFTEQPGSSHALAGDWIWLAECTWRMGSEHRDEALIACNRAIDAWRELLRKGARWPAYHAYLAEALELKGRILESADDRTGAEACWIEAQNVLEGLPLPAAQHSQVLLLGSRVRIELWRLQGVTDPSAWASVDQVLQTLRERGACAQRIEEIQTLGNQAWKQRPTETGAGR